MEDNQTIDTPVLSAMTAEKAALKAKVQSLSSEEIAYAIRQLFQDPSDDGREVDPLLAEECLTRYKEEMITRYVLASGDTVPGTPNMTVLAATHFVKFNGRGFKEWVLEQFYGPLEQDAVDFKMANGIYTEKFLEAYFPGNEPEKDKRRNRITIFVIPYEKGTSKVFAGGSAYDLGGLEP